MKRRTFSHRRHRRGSVTPLVVVSLVAILALAGLIVDGGLLISERRRAQAVADSSALAGGQDLLQLTGTLQARQSAVEYANMQGYANDGATALTVNIPPLSGPRAGDASFIEVVAAATRSASFMRAAGNNTVATAGARAVAGVVRTKPSRYALVALSPHAAGALTVTGTGIINITGAPVQVNSDSPQALLMEGSVSANAQGWNVVGGAGSAPYTPVNGGGGGNGTGAFSPAPITGAAPVVDPMQNMRAPDISGLSSQAAVNVSGTASQTLQPGIYSGGITASGSSSLTLSPGLYVLDGGGLRITDSAQLNAPGVTFFNTGNASNFGPVNISSFNASFSPPTSGANQGLMFFQDRQNSQAAQVNDSSRGLSGTCYFPAASFSFNANGGSLDHLQIIADRITMNTDTSIGNADINIPYDANVLARPPQLYLVE